MYSGKFDSIFPPIHKFGPVNVTVFEETQGSAGDQPEDTPRTRTAASAAIACVYLMVGANIMLVYMYSVDWHLSFMNNLHILFCSFGFQLLIPMGILMQSKINGPSQPLTPEERTNQHILLQAVGSLMGLIGAVACLLFGKTETLEDEEYVDNADTIWTLHCVIGIIACAFALASVVTGIYFKMRAKFLKWHPVCGVAAYFTSSVCFALGVRKNGFVEYIPMSMWPDVSFICIGFCSLSTLVVIYFPLTQIIGKRLLSKGGALVKHNRTII